MNHRDKYMAAFKAIRPTILARDGNKCAKCGSNLTLEVHHIDGYSNNNPELLITLCCLCHGIAPMGEEPFSQWLLLGENGIDVLQCKLANHGITRMTRNQIFIFCEALTEFNLDMRVKQLKMARERIRKSGIKCDGRKAFGERDGEAATLETINKLRLEGKCAREIAEYLNANNISSRMKLRWRTTTISKIMAREGRRSF